MLASLIFQILFLDFYLQYRLGLVALFLMSILKVKSHKSLLFHSFLEYSNYNSVYRLLVLSNHVLKLTNHRRVFQHILQKLALRNKTKNTTGRELAKVFLLPCLSF